MASIINLTIKSDFKAASADLKKFEIQSESTRKSIEKFQAGFKEESIKKFNDRLARSTAAVKATRGPLAALTHEHRALQRQIESLIRKGLDPEGKEVKELTTRYQKLEKELKDVNDQQKKNQKTTGSSALSMAALGTAAVLAGKQAVTAMIDFSKESAQAASAAEEIAGKYSVVFREIEDGGASMASSLAEDYDLAKSTAQELLGNTGDLLTGFGLATETAARFSDETNRLALELASFTNAQGGAAAVSKALTSAYANEREALKTYGIVISQAMVDERLLQDAKKGLIFESEKEAIAAATLALATEQSKNAIGDYARTAESSANTTRRLAESQKELKEALGVSINEGLTPFKAALADITKEYADLINKQNQAKAFTKDLRDGIVDETMSLEELKTALAGFELQKEAGRGRFVEDDIIAIQALIDAYGIQDAWLTKLNDAAEVNGRVSADAQARINAQLEKSNEAIARLNDIRESQLTTTEKQVQALNAEINEWVKFREIPGVQETINALVEERNTLLDAEAKKVQELAEKEAERAEKEAEKIAIEKATHQEWLDSQLSAEQEFFDEQDRIGQENHEKELARIAEKKQMYLNFAGSVLGGMSSLFSSIDTIQATATDKQLDRIDLELEAQKAAMSEGFKNSEAGQKQIEKLEEEAAKKKAEIEYKSAMTSWKLQLAGAIATGAQAILAGFASQPFLPVGLAMGALATGIAGVQVGTVIANKPQQPSFQTGTGIVPFTVPDNNMSSRADSTSIAVSPGEKVQVTPRGESNQTGTMNAVFKIGEAEMYRFINVGIESGDIVISQDNIQGGQAV